MTQLLIKTILIIFLGTVIFTIGCSDQSKAHKPILRFSGIPDQDVTRWARRYDVLEQYLAQKLGIAVKGIPASSYSSVVLAFSRGDVQLGWFGGLTGVQARLAVPGARAIAQRPQDKRFRSVFIVNGTVRGESLSSLTGLTFTFGNEVSTSGHLMPRHFLLSAGINPDTDFLGNPGFSSSHDQTWKLVEAGAFQSGALSESVWDRALRENKVNLSKIRELTRTPPYFDYNWTIRPDLDKDFGEGFTLKLKRTLLSITDAQSLELFSTDRFIETRNENYATIETVARQTKIIK